MPKNQQAKSTDKSNKNSSSTWSLSTKSKSSSSSSSLSSSSMPPPTAPPPQSSSSSPSSNHHQIPTEKAPKSVGLRIQTKLGSRLATMKTMKVFLDESSSQLLDNVYLLLRHHCGDEAKKLMKYLIQLIVKITILWINKQFNETEMEWCELFQEKFHEFCELFLAIRQKEKYAKKLCWRPRGEPTVEKIRTILLDCVGLVKQITKRHFSDKSKRKLNFIIHAFGKESLLEQLLTALPVEKQELENQICEDLQDLLDRGMI